MAGRIKLWLVALSVAILSGSGLTGCGGAQYHQQAVQPGAGEKLTVGTVQREIRVGMSGGEVAAVLGSPNIVTTDEERREVWIYDRISTERVYSADSGGISSLIFGGGGIGSSGLLGGAVAPSYSSGSGAASTSQQTFTVIIKFDQQKRVRDFAYHTSRF